MHETAKLRIVSAIRGLKESAQECCRFIRNANDFVCCLTIEFETFLRLGTIDRPESQIISNSIVRQQTKSLAFRIKRQHSCADSFRPRMRTRFANFAVSCIIPLYSMGTRTLAVLITIAFSVIGVVGDYFLKLRARASSRTDELVLSWLRSLRLDCLRLGFVMKNLKLATISVLYSVSLFCCLPRSGVCCSRSH